MSDETKGKKRLKSFFYRELVIYDRGIENLIEKSEGKSDGEVDELRSFPCYRRRFYRSRLFVKSMIYAENTHNRSTVESFACIQFAFITAIDPLSEISKLDFSHTSAQLMNLPRVPQHAKVNYRDRLYVPRDRHRVTIKFVTIQSHFHVSRSSRDYKPETERSL
jgi:hypothetical protein